ncbi:MAG: PHP domain-containing protein [Bacillota bacterium]
MDKLILELNHHFRIKRLGALRALVRMVNKGEIQRPVQANDVNNHIHTSYSFSPYSPTMALWMAYMAGLVTAGIMDHDSICGAEEFIEAGKIIGMGVTVGVECRVDFSMTSLGGRRLNNPDQDSIAYVTLHGVPHTQIDKVRKFFEPLIAFRHERNKRMTARLNEILAPHGISINYERDVCPLSMSYDGGSVTERHLLFAVSKKIVAKYGRGADVVEFLEKKLGIEISKKNQEWLSDPENKFYEYDLLGVLKSDLVKGFYENAKDECPPVEDLVKLANEVGAIAAYAYLGDVTDSVTGDKKAQKFEDDFLDELFDELAKIGFKTITYMPSRNSKEQLQRVKALCEEHQFFQISGEDINSPRQTFVCEAQRSPEFSNLIDATWALIGHEKAATKDLKKAFFYEETVEKIPVLNERIEAYKIIGKSK